MEKFPQQLFVTNEDTEDGKTALLAWRRRNLRDLDQPVMVAVYRLESVRELEVKRRLKPTRVKARRRARPPATTITHLHSL
jgi:hypothetical protein